ncbi:hypothetical protein TUM3794_28990 [Shewanella colwelliana]|uniref:Uncharacterized protein n=1 Tax=Shewanella colwelliana TaxID=23 RepID=A0ABQ4P7A9_SHECO|nr:hypothetical protein TUM3794_28990 [Shewanella colwelliana]
MLFDQQDEYLLYAYVIFNDLLIVSVQSGCLMSNLSVTAGKVNQVIMWQMSPKVYLMVFYV